VFARSTPIARDGRPPGTYSDAAISGSTMILRPGVRSLLHEALAGRFDVVLAEALDRLSRDQEDIAALFKRLRFAGVPIITLSEGEISELHVGLKGTMNALFLKELAAKTHRGLRGRVEAGKAAAATSVTATASFAPSTPPARSRPASGRSFPNRPRSSGHVPRLCGRQEPASDRAGAQ
jgi:hypothetical protein